MNSKLLFSVVVDLNGNFGRGILAGAQTYALEYPGVEILCEDVESLRERVDDGVLKRAGVLAQVATPPMLEILRNCNLPMVNVSNTLGIDLWPRVINDDVAIGRMAAEYFLEREHRSFAWSGSPGISLSRERRQGFAERLAEAGFEEILSQETEMTRTDKSYGRWLSQLPGPCAVFSFSDYRARTLALAGLNLGIAIPEDAAILGVDNDDQLVWQVPGGLSSVRPNARRIGYLAVKTLHTIAEGGDVPPLQRVPPLGVQERNSSNLIAVADPSLRKALGFIHQHAMDGIGVNEVAEAAGLSRRQLEQRFSAVLKRKVYGEIQRRRLDHAEALLRETELSVEEIARRIGYPEVRQLSTAFRKAKGLAPREYRKTTRLSRT